MIQQVLKRNDERVFLQLETLLNLFLISIVTIPFETKKLLSYQKFKTAKIFSTYFNILYTTTSKLFILRLHIYFIISQ